MARTRKAQWDLPPLSLSSSLREMRDAGRINVRYANVLLNGGFETLNDLKDRNAVEVFEQTLNCGKRCLVAVNEVLQDLGQRDCTFCKTLWDPKVWR